MNYKAGQGHTGADLSEADILASMYFGLLRYRISAEVVNVSSIRPLDREGIIKSVPKTGRALTVEEHVIHGGGGSLVSEIVAEEGLCCRVKRIGFMEGKFAIP